MKWAKISEWCLQSECRTYTVTKYGTADGWLYEAWLGKEMLGTRLPSSEAAKTLIAQQEKR